MRLPGRSRESSGELPPGVQAVGVFVNWPADRDGFARTLALRFTAVQLHGDEPPPSPRGGRTVPVIKAFARGPRISASPRWTNITAPSAFLLDGFACGPLRRHRLHGAIGMSPGALCSARRIMSGGWSHARKRGRRNSFCAGRMPWTSPAASNPGPARRITRATAGVVCGSPPHRRAANAPQTGTTSAMSSTTVIPQHLARRTFRSLRRPLRSRDAGGAARRLERAYDAARRPTRSFKRNSLTC